MSWEYPDPNARRRLRRAVLVIVFVVIPLVALVGWNFFAVQRRTALLADVGRHGVGYVSAAERDLEGATDIGVALVMADARRQGDPNSSIVSDRPAVHRIGALRSWLGDEAIAMILLWDVNMLPTYRSAFPEAWIIADPGFHNAGAAPLAGPAAAH